MARCAAAAIGGVALPLLYLAIADGPDVTDGFRVGLGVAIAALTLAGEILERHLFFVAAAAPRMPGGVP